MKRTSFDLPLSTHARLRWAKYTTGKPMGQLVAEALVDAYPEPPHRALAVRLRPRPDLSAEGVGGTS